MQPHFRTGPYGHAAQPVQQRTPSSAPRRGGPGPMMPGPHAAMPRAAMAPNVANAPPQQDMVDIGSLHAASKRRSRKPTDKTLPEGVEDCIVNGDSALRYKELRDFERRLDATMTRKRLDAMDVVSRNAKRCKTLRIWISNTAEDQPWQTSALNVDAFDFTPNKEPAFRVKIEGCLIDTHVDDVAYSAGKTNGPAQGPTEASDHSRSRQQRPCFTDFFKKMTVEFDPNRHINAESQNITWTKSDHQKSKQSKPTAPPAFDEFSFKRSGSENINITVNLFQNENPERQSLSPELAEIVDTTQATWQEATLGMWEYIKLMGLQDDEEKCSFRCDELLRKVVNADVGSIPSIGDYVSNHLKPISPVALPYTIRVDEEFHKQPEPTVYDIQVVTDNGPRSKTFPPQLNPEYPSDLKEINSLDDQLATLVGAVSHSRAKHTFFTSLAGDPTGFFRSWLSSQKRDLEVIMGEATRGGGEDAVSEEWRRGGRDSVWATPNARESVHVMLMKR